MRFELSPESLLTVRARDLETGKETSAKMVTLQTPHSLKESVEAAMKESGREKAGWFNAFAHKILGQ